jgi:type IV secretion system protein TrbI
MRLSRKVLTGLVGVGAILISGMLIFALYQGSRRPGSDSELYNTDNKSTPDGLSGLPRDYAGIVQDKPQQEAVRFAAPALADVANPT